MDFSGQVWGLPVRVVVKIIQQASIKNHGQIYHQVDFMCNVDIALFCGSFICMGRLFCVWVKGHWIFQQPPQNLLKNVAQTWVNMEPQMPTRNPCWALFKHLLSFFSSLPSFMAAPLTQSGWKKASTCHTYCEVSCTDMHCLISFLPLGSRKHTSDSQWQLSCQHGVGQHQSWEAGQIIGYSHSGRVHVWICTVHTGHFLNAVGTERYSDPISRSKTSFLKSICVEINWLDLIWKPGRVDMEDSWARKHMSSKMRF